MRTPPSSWFRPIPPIRPIDNNIDLSKILKIALAILGILASFAFLTAEIAFIGTIAIVGISYFSLQRINNIYYRRVAPRPLLHRTFPFWSGPAHVHPNPWFWQTRAPVGDGRPSPISPALPRSSTRPVSFRAPTPRREPPRRGFFHREPPRARVGERR